MEARSLALVTILLVAAGDLVLRTSASLQDQANLRALCGNKHIEITRSRQVGALVRELNKGPSGCPSRVVLALFELDQLINDATDVCSLEKVEKIKRYYEKFVAQSLIIVEPSGEPKSELVDDILPRPLKNFVLGYALRVSHLCKKNMINSLQYESRQLLEEADFEHMQPWIGERSAMSQIMDEPRDYDDLMLPRDVSRALQDSRAEPSPEEDQHDKVFLQMPTGQLISQTQAFCRRRFKPIYEQLILPLIYLSNMGFNYQGEDLEREMRELSVNKEVHQWYRIVYLCECLDGIEIVEDPEDAKKTEGTDRSLVRILTKEEADEIKAARAPSNHGDDETVAKVVFKPHVGNQLEDEILNLRDKNFMRMVNTFETHKNDIDRIRLRLFKKMGNFLLSRLKQGKFKFVGSLMGAKKKLENPGDTNHELVMMFDEYVRREAATNSGDAPVSFGLGRVVTGTAKRYYHQAAYNGASGLAMKVKEATIDKAKAARYFYYFIAVGLFLSGVLCLALG